MAEELLEKIPPEKRWAITAKNLWRFIILRGDKIIAPDLGKDEGIFAPVMGAEKWDELSNTVFAKGGKKMFPQIKEMFDIPVEDAIGATKLSIVFGTLFMGPEFLSAIEIIEETRERVVLRYKCPHWERYKEFDVDPAIIPCGAGHQLLGSEGLKVVNPKITYKLTKALPWGDPYCEDVYEFKDK
jgi:hypothetical protein